MVTMGAVNMVAVVAAAMLLMAVPEAAAWNWTATPELVAESVERSINKSISSSSSSRRHVLEGGGLPGCGSGNPIDNCWRCDPQWYRRRQRLADCAVGFGRNAVGGKHGRIYVVMDPSDEDAVNPRAGTLRHAVIQTEPLWIVFAHDMHIRLSQELLVQSYKTIDGRGARVHVAHGACITLQYVSHVIIHGIRVHDCVPTGNAMVRDSVRHYGWRTVADGDGISLFGATHVWIDRVSLWRCSDGLIDAIMASSAITVSNCHLSHHDKAMLLGHSDSYHPDKAMQVTIALNKFGPGLTQRMPRCRHGFFHVVNNEYLEWQMYAVGGSAGPTILSQGNRYAAPGDPFAKEVTKRVDTEEGEWKHWDWRSANDVLLNGAFFTQSGHRNSPALSLLFSSSAASSLPSSMVPLLTAQAGALDCRLGSPC